MRVYVQSWDSHRDAEPGQKLALPCTGSVPLHPSPPALGQISVTRSRMETEKHGTQRLVLNDIRLSLSVNVGEEIAQVQQFSSTAASLRLFGVWGVVWRVVGNHIMHNIQYMLGAGDL